MTKKIVFGAALALVIVGIAAPSASAVCPTPKSASSFNVANAQYAYFVPSIPAPTIIVGRAWSANGDHTGTCPAFYFSGPGVGFNQALGDACTGAGCPPQGGTMSIQVTVGNDAGATQTLLTKVIETPANSVNWDYSAGGNLNLGTAARPRATSSSRVATNVSLTLGVDAAAPNAFNGSASDITAYNIVSSSSATDPGPAASNYTLRSTIPAAGGTAGTGAATVDCSNIANDQWVAVQIVTGAAGGSTSVGERTRVKCDPALANPKFNVIPKKSMGTKTNN